jgi:hypothetical protein
MSPRIPAGGSVPKGAQAFVQQVLAIGSWTGDLGPATSLPAAGARAMSRLVLAHPAVADGARSDTPLALFGATADPRLEALRSDAVGYLVAGALALGMTGHEVDKLADRLVFAAASIDPASLLQRHRLAGGKPFGPPPPVIPEWLDQLDEFLARNCFAGVVDAVLELGKWAGGGSRSDATGISSLSATSVCPGTPLTISGSGFGATQPADTKVYVPAGNGCREATVTSWSDTAIVVQLPPDVGAGCVGFVRGGMASLGEPQRVTGELMNCIGPAAEAWTRGFGKVGKSAIVSCPPCLPGGQNRIQAGGRPVINAFRFTPAHVEPGGQPVLSWNVSNASSLQITGVSGNGPALALPSPLPPLGSITLAPVGGLVPVHGRYRLTATNACGTATADAEFDMSRTPALSVIRIEVVQSIQKVDNSVHLTANRTTAVRVFVGSGITDGFDLGDGPNRVAGVTVSLQAENLGNGSLRNCGSPWPGSQATPSPNRDSLADSFNFDVPLSAATGLVRFHAFVEFRPSPGQPPLSSAAGTVDVVFTPKPNQELLPILIADPSSTSPTPTLANFFANFNGVAGPAHAQPFQQGGFTVNPALTMTLSGAESLKSGINWSWVAARLATMIFLFPSTPVGGIRSGIVPSDGAYPWGGMALPRVGATAPSFIVQAGQPQTCAHELGHTYGFLHVNCGGPAGPFGGLPLTITAPGVDVQNRSIMPAGSSELMSYCSPQWPSIPHWESMFNSIPIS